MKQNEKKHRNKEDREFQKEKNSRRTRNKSSRKMAEQQAHEEGTTKSVMEHLGGTRDAVKKASASSTTKKWKDS